MFMSQQRISPQIKTVQCENTQVTIQIPMQGERQQFTRDPSVSYCSKCNNKIQTNVQLKIGKGQLLFAVLLLPKLFCACVLPFFFDRCKDAVHQCPICKAEVGRKNFIFE